MRFRKQVCESYLFCNPYPNPNPNPNLNPNPNPNCYSSYKSSLFARVKVFSYKSVIYRLFLPTFSKSSKRTFLYCVFVNFEKQV